jgi:hypothetical protein
MLASDEKTNKQTNKQKKKNNNTLATIGHHFGGARFQASRLLQNNEVRGKQ